MQKAYRGTISGLALSGDVSNALPSELAYLNDSDLENLFALKFAEKIAQLRIRKSRRKNSRIT